MLSAAKKWISDVSVADAATMPRDSAIRLLMKSAASRITQSAVPIVAITAAVRRLITWVVQFERQSATIWYKLACMRFRGILIAILCGAAYCQTQPAFEVASVKPYDPASGARYTMRGGPGTSDPERFSCQNCSLRSLIVAAYDIKEFQLTSPSAPDRYDVEAKVPPGATKEQFRSMLQNLLADRFHLQLHHQPQEMTVYMLIVGKGGSKLTPSQSPAATPDPALPTVGPIPTGSKNGFPAPPPGYISTTALANGTYRMGATNAPMTKVVSMLSLLLARPVHDGTGLEAGYDFQLFWSGNASTDNPAPRLTQDGTPIPSDPDADSGPTLFAAVQQQLGLKLESKKDQVDVLVVDRADKIPTVN